jgi:hypothetical protein
MRRVREEERIRRRRSRSKRRGWRREKGRRT